MLANFIKKAIENSYYVITDSEKRVEQSKDEIQVFKVNPGDLTVEVTPQNTFKVKGQNEHQDELKEIIDEGIKPFVREEALKILDEGTEKWNEWRTTHGQLKVDFTDINFAGKDFSTCDFKGVIFNDANLSETNLQGTDFNGCEMRRTKFIGANLKNANLTMVNAQLADFSNAHLMNTKLGGAKLNAAKFKKAELTDLKLRDVELNYACFDKATFSVVDLSEMILNEETSFKNAIGIEKGINGVWNKDTDTAGLFSIKPPGNSMKGPSSKAVLESLKRARKYLGFSFLLSVLTVLIIYLELKTITLPYPQKLNISIVDYYRIAAAFSIGFLFLSKTYMDDAFEGMKYLENRNSVMEVASFPWPISRYISEKWHHKITSYLLRSALALHPFIYLFVFGYNNIYEIVLLLILIPISIWILISSQRFQQPILFDNKKEEREDEESIKDKLDKIYDSLQGSQKFQR